MDNTNTELEMLDLEIMYPNDMLQDYLNNRKPMSNYFTSHQGKLHPVKFTGDRSVLQEVLLNYNKSIDAHDNVIANIELLSNEQTKVVITGQQPQITSARKSISGFKLREGDPLGVMVVLRGAKMWQFLDKLISIALPRVKDFRGTSKTAFDGQGNYSLGLEEQIIFPEIEYDKIEKIRGLQVNIVTNTKSNEEAQELLKLLGMPFEKEEKK